MTIARKTVAPQSNVFFFIGIAACCFAFYLSVTSLAFAQESAPEVRPVSAGDRVPLRPLPAASEAKGTLADFAWLSGKWQGAWGPRTAELVWMEPKAGIVVGTLRLDENNKTLVIELFSLIERSGGIEFRTRHFNPSLAPWEKSDADSLALATLDQKTAIFQNSVDGTTKRTILTRIDPDSFLWRSEIVPIGSGIQATQITYRRVK